MLDALRAKEVQRRQVYADELRLIREIDARGLCNERGHYVGAAALIREILNLSMSDLRRMVTHAELLNETTTPTSQQIEPKLPVVATALGEGLIAPEHVEAIRKALKDLPDTATIEDRVVAEKLLTEAAKSSDPHLVKRLGEEIERRLDPDGDEPKEKTLLNPTRRLDIRERKDGDVSGSFDLDAEGGALLKKPVVPADRTHR